MIYLRLSDSVNKSLSFSLYIELRFVVYLLGIQYGISFGSCGYNLGLKRKVQNPQPK